MIVPDRHPATRLTGTPTAALVIKRPVAGQSERSFYPLFARFLASLDLAVGAESRRLQ
jgi:hypothetical protein